MEGAKNFLKKSNLCRVKNVVYISLKKSVLKGKENTKFYNLHAPNIYITYISLFPVQQQKLSKRIPFNPDNPSVSTERTSL